MKKLLIPLILIVILSTSCQQSINSSEVISTELQDLDALETEVTTAVEALNNALVDPDQPILEKYTDDKLRYGHSAGLIEDKKTFVESLVSGKYNFVDADISEQTINMLDNNNAVVEYVIFANTHDADKDPGTIKLKVLQIWHRDATGWRLVARQGVKI